MGVLSWLALVALVVYRIPTVSAIDDVIVHVVSLIDDKDILQNVTDLAMDRAAIKTFKTPSPQEGDCLESRLKEHKKIGLILITKGKKCMDVGANTRRLLLSYDAAKKQFTTDKGESFKVTELGKPLNAFVARLIVEGKLQQTEIRVPVFSIVFVGVLVGLLLALSCIFFSKYRAAISKTHPIEKPNFKKSKGGCSQGTSGKMQKKGSSRSSKSSSSKLELSKGKKRERKESCRSSKSLATKTCDISGPSSVKVISVPSPKQKQKQNNVSPPAFPLSKDEVTTVTATSEAVQPVRDLERVRAPATVPNSSFNWKEWRREMEEKKEKLGDPWDDFVTHLIWHNINTLMVSCPLLEQLPHEGRQLLLGLITKMMAKHAALCESFRQTSSIDIKKANDWMMLQEEAQRKFDWAFSQPPRPSTRSMYEIVYDHLQENDIYDSVGILYQLRDEIDAKYGWDPDYCSSAAPTVPTSTAPPTTVTPTPTVSAPTVPVSSIPPTTVVPAPTVSQSSVPEPTTTYDPQNYYVHRTPEGVITKIIKFKSQKK